jgi:hypothetical protein
MPPAKKFRRVGAEPDVAKPGGQQPQLENNDIVRIVIISPTLRFSRARRWR